MYKYSWKRDKPDHRDFKFAYSAARLPGRVDLTSQMPAVYDQGYLGSCTAQAAAAAFSYTLKLERKQAYTPSRLYIYYNERMIDGTIPYDAGSSIRTSMKALNKYGGPHEELWPYIPEKMAVAPKRVAYVDGNAHLATQYLSIGQSLSAMKSCLSQGFPIVFGFLVYESFESYQVANTGMVPTPGPSEELLGGHAALIVGYDDSMGRFIVRNSWGPDWGIGGYFFLPYQYAANSNLSGDFWSLRFVK